MIFLFNWVIGRFNVNFPECPVQFSTQIHPTNSHLLRGVKQILKDDM